MKRVDRCIVCGKAGLLKYQGRLAPFISRYVFDSKETEASLCLCPSCQMLFSDVRFDGDEMRRLYEGYRGERYSRIREECEPGYSAINDQLGASADELRNRRALCESLLAVHSGPIRSVLDYGGDRGQFIPPSLSGTQRYVFDLSGVEPDPGIVSLAAPDAEAPYDLVMCCHVLEHQPFPIDTLGDLRRLVGPQGLLYLEVPAGIPTHRYLTATVARSSLGSRKPPVMHEHINQFTRCSLENALRIAGFRPLATRIRLVDYGRTHAPVIASVAVPDAPRADRLHGRFSLFLEGIEYALRRNVLPPFAVK